MSSARSFAVNRCQESGVILGGALRASARREVNAANELRPPAPIGPWLTRVRRRRRGGSSGSRPRGRRDLRPNEAGAGAAAFLDGRARKG
eukprot:6304349-Alexandrium_andersonii.AAC.1